MIITGTGVVTTVTRPVTRPDEEPIVAVDRSPLSQVPPVMASANIVVDPWHTFRDPAIGAGNGLTVTVVVAAQTKPGTT